MVIKTNVLIFPGSLIQPGNLFNEALPQSYSRRSLQSVIARSNLATRNTLIFDHIMNATWVAWGLLIIASFNSCLGNILLKKSRLEAPDPGLISLLFSPWFMAAVMVYGINLIVFAKALDQLPVSVAYPIFAAIGFSLVAVGGSFLLGERLSLKELVGMAVIVTGIIIMSHSPLK